MSSDDNASARCFKRKEVAAWLDVEPKTVDRWVRASDMHWHDHPTHRGIKLLAEADVQRLAALHQRELGVVARRIIALEAEVARLAALFPASGRLPDALSTSVVPLAVSPPSLATLDGVEAIRRPAQRATAPTFAPRPRRPVQTRPLTPPPRGEVPPDCVPLHTLANKHHIAASTVRKALQPGKHVGPRLYAIHTDEPVRVPGTPRARASTLLNPKAQDVFHRLWPEHFGDPCRYCGWSSRAPLGESAPSAPTPTTTSITRARTSSTR